MTLALMGFLFGVSLVGSAAGLVADAGLQKMRARSRLLWLAVMALGPVLLVVGALVPRSEASAAGSSSVVAMPGLTVAAVAAGSRWLDAVAAAVWVCSGLAFLCVLIRTHVVLARERQHWTHAQIMDRDVLLSSDRGPAVVGLVAPRVVLPRWALSLPDAQLRMIVLHEEEHVRANDPALLAAALALVVATAWNPLTWWQLQRLRMAVELDCDGRVLRRAPDPCVYGESLIAVAARASGLSVGLAAFTRRSLSLEKRIVALTAEAGRWAAVRGGALVLIGGLLGAQTGRIEAPWRPLAVATAEGAETPVMLRREDDGVAFSVGSESSPAVPPVDATAAAAAPGEAPPAAAPAEETASGDAATEQPAAPQVGTREFPMFTPFTVLPRLANEAEVQQVLARAYSNLLGEARVEGTVTVRLHVAPDGVASQAQVVSSSGSRALDRAATEVAAAMRFSPALNRDRAMPVDVEIPITFQTPAAR